LIHCTIVACRQCDARYAHAFALFAGRAFAAGDVGTQPEVQRDGTDLP
jgi:hypothetical protein